jgi:RHS repeat-associated protein
MPEDLPNNPGVVHHCTAEILSTTEQYAFGMEMPGRSFSVEDYRYGFNGKENQDELMANNNSQDFGARMYDARVGRWWGMDPLAKSYANLSPYSAFADSPIFIKDPNGKENVIYLTDLDLQNPQLAPAKRDEIICNLKEIAADANEQYARNGINIIVSILDYIPEASELDKTDVLATIGSKKQLMDFDTKYGYKNNGKPDDFHNGIYDFVGADGMDGPERSSGIVPTDNGNRIALDRGRLSSDIKGTWGGLLSEVEYASFCIRHGSVHNCLLGHENGSKNLMKEGKMWGNKEDFAKHRNVILSEHKKILNGITIGNDSRPHFSGKMPVIRLPESRSKNHGKSKTTPTGAKPKTRPRF